MAKKSRSKPTLSKKQIKSKAKIRLSFNNLENLNLDDSSMPSADSTIQEVPQTANLKGSKAINDLVVIPPLDMDVVVEPDDLSDSADEDPDPRGNWTHVIGRKRSRSPVSSPNSPPLLQFTMEDVQPELEYWSTAVICYVLGGNPPWELLSGFVSRLWRKYKYDKISFLPNGAFLVRFPTMECKELVLKQGFPMFDNKPLVVKPWTENASLAKEKVKAVPIWIRLCGLGLKFWGESCLTKLGSLIGKFMRADGPTIDKTRLGYARLMTEVEIGQDLPYRLFFKDEKGVENCVVVEYEWRPDAPIPAPPKPVQTKVWRPVIRQNVVNKGKVPLYDEGTSVSAAHPYGAPIIHNSSVMVPVSPIIQMVRQEHNPHVSPTKSYVEAVLSDTESPKKEGGVGSSGLFGLVETKVKIQHFDSILNNLGQHWHGVNNNIYHPGGRVWVIWAPHMFNVQIIDCSAQQITSEITEIATGDVFYFTWLGSPVSGDEIADFRLCVDYCDIMDIQAQGSFFTWNNKQDPSTRVFSRLDRCLITNDWMQLYPDSYAYFMNEGMFDHSPIVCFRRKDVQFRKASFKYFNMWGMDADFKTIVKREWDKYVHGITMYQVITKLKNLKKSLRLLNKNRYADIKRAAEVARAQLDYLQPQMHRQPGDPLIIQRENDDVASFYSLQKARASFLQQKAKTAWLSEGDENSAFFHRQIKSRNFHNKVLQIKDVQGTNHREPAAIETAFLDYYKELLGSSTSVHKVHVPTVRTGPDGYTSQFFRDSWEILGKELFHAINKFFNTGKLLKKLNSTNITLVPKVPNPSSVTDFRSIACCNTIYKCIAKLLCTRLGKVLYYLRLWIVVKLNHLLFADDLHLFSKGYELSIMWLLRSFATFSMASGLCFNKDKSEIYFNGMSQGAMDSILQVSGFKRGVLPFKYLGVPISSRKLTKNDGMRLIDKITTRIRSWGAKHLSYAGRLTLVNSVLSGLHSCWSSIFLIPNGILNKIDAICRNYLWRGKDTYMNAPNVNWGGWCTPKDEGGLGIKSTKLWNKALLGKYVWWLATKKDHLWVKWVNHVYLKGCDWTSYEPPIYCSWSWRKIAQLLKTFAPTYSSGKWLGEDIPYKVMDGYNWISGRCISTLQHYLHKAFPATELSDWFTRHHGGTKLQKRVICAAHVAVLYAIWRARNKARVDQMVINPGTPVRQVLNDVIARLWAKNSGVVSNREGASLASISP
ncbi:uncharacterized protein LOC141649654 [Silene latifolia]|uniref:uncharacterized protein LOC141649654 n=1 Tax=Silene latifolia TaxID=37657 RepID=UPI003D772D6F